MSSVKLIHITPDAEKLIAYCARVSSPNQDNPKIAGLIKYLITHKHWSPLEMAGICVEIETTRAIAPQILRHRSFHFQEFCISGDSLVTTLTKSGHSKKIAISKLYDYQNNPRINVIWDRGIRVFDENSKTFKRSIIKEVFKTGKKITHIVTLEDGKKIRSTMEHKFLDKINGFVPLSDLNIGNIIGVNGQNLYQDKDWLLESKRRNIFNKKGLQGIADEAGCSYHTIRKWLKVHSIQFTKQEVSEYTTAWNKDLPTEEQPMYGKLHLDCTREKMKKSSVKGEHSNLFKNGNTRADRLKIADWQFKYKNRLIKEANGACTDCGSSESLEIDHIIPVSQNLDLAYEYSNLQILCKPCHRFKTTIEKNQAIKTVRWKKIVNIEYFGEEDTYDLEVEHDSHNYIANGVVVHNSQRYSEAPGYEKYEARRQDLKNKQNSIDDISEEDKQWFIDAQNSVIRVADSLYQKALEKNIAKEQARMLLPLNTKTKLYMHGTIRDFVHYCEVRCDVSTQKEHRDIADQVKSIIIEQLPNVSEAMGWTTK